MTKFQALRQRWNVKALSFSATMRKAAMFFIAGGCAIIPAIAQLTDAPATFVTLGTGGGPLIRTERSEPANAVLVGGAAYLFDLGDGVQRQLLRAAIPLTKVRAIFISHHHNDHNADLGPVLINRWLLYSTNRCQSSGLLVQRTSSVQSVSAIVQRSWPPLPRAAH